MIPSFNLNDAGVADDSVVRLWRAVLLLAISDLRSHDEAQRHHARLWLCDSYNRNVGSAFWICQHLGVDQDALRRAIRQSPSRPDPYLSRSPSTA